MYLISTQDSKRLYRILIVNVQTIQKNIKIRLRNMDKITPIRKSNSLLVMEINPA